MNEDNFYVHLAVCTIPGKTNHTNQVHARHERCISTRYQLCCSVMISLLSLLTSQHTSLRQFYTNINATPTTHTRPPALVSHSARGTTRWCCSFVFFFIVRRMGKNKAQMRCSAHQKKCEDSLHINQPSTQVGHQRENSLNFPKKTTILLYTAKAVVRQSLHDTTALSGQSALFIRGQ